ncbi:aminopeptidase N [Actimicrobium sp. GrIS 1.19]|uniref:M1 family metallopeptidase n=1 Tax=Actimicrobium sp. GrIS 1.19 TaxID=3071708 RepID=UPI002DFE6E01|nr:aminopeptidase N [Actimicrobium sp. GrIS 1.19]
MPRILLSAAFFALTGLADAASAKPAPLLTPTATTSQLPRNVRPSHYAVSTTPDKAASSFTAQVVISIDVLAPTSTITLNAAELTFNSASLLAANANTSPDPARISLDADNETATFTFAHPISRGKYRLALNYTGLIGTQAAGLFSLDYEVAGVRQRALYTQFENSDARRVIASWDEPAYKATFALEVNLPGDEVAVSNMPIEQSTPQPGGRKLVRFAQSPTMSTYLLFYGQGNFERASVRVGATELGLITKPGVLPQGQFSLEASAAVLREYNDYFGLPFPLPKLDNIAAPGRSQFFGAMENWGAIFTFEYGLLLDPAISTQLDKQRVFTFAAHEIAHQWFGDLVTMQWWDDLWLNEGFASWMEGRTTALLHPEWHTALASSIRASAP